VERHVPPGAGRPILLALLLALPAAGCLAPAPPPGVPGPHRPAAATGAPPPVDYRCDAALLFQFVPYAATDRDLPPGFHPRDPQGFLGPLGPVAFGQAGVLLIEAICRSPQGPFDATSLDIFVEHPAVPGLPVADFDFYELERYGAPDQLGGALLGSDWPLHPGTMSLWLGNGTVESVVRGSGADPYRTVNATVSDEHGPLYSFTAATSAPVGVTGTSVRFWHDSPAGLMAIDYGTHLDTQLGGALVCSVRPGSALAGYVAASQLGKVASDSGYYGCPVANPVVASFPLGFALNATVSRLPGVHAG